MNKTYKLFKALHEFDDTTEHSSLYMERMLFVVFAKDSQEALTMAMEAQIIEYREKGTWTVEEVKERVVRCRP